MGFFFVRTLFGPRYLRYREVRTPVLLLLGSQAGSIRRDQGVRAGMLGVYLLQVGGEARWGRLRGAFLQLGAGAPPRARHYRPCWTHLAMAQAEDLVQGGKKIRDRPVSASQ